MRAIENSNAGVRPPVTITNTDHCDLIFYGDGDDEYFRTPESSHLSAEFDEDGFPSVSLPRDDHNNNDEESFASSFYRSGSDWSCLAASESTKKNSNVGCNGATLDRKMKQVDLIQLWGLKKRENGGADVDGDSSKKLKTLSGTGSNLNGKLLSLRKKNENGGVSDIRSKPRVCPFYKKIPGTPCSVDAFRYGNIEGCLAYFLTHFHGDHYGGLTKGWSHGPIYCTPLTARLVRMCLYVDPLFIRPLELNEEYVIEGVRVTLLEANHCPGAALIHFLLPGGRCILHTGDFRASKTMQAYPLLLKHQINVLYLDTTYCNPKYKFPPKEDVLDYVVRVTRNHLKKQQKTLVVVGAYSIGKECVYLAISKALEVKIYASASRRRILQTFNWPHLSERICTNAESSFLHVLPISCLRFEALDKYLETFKDTYRAVLAFRPTGWTYSEKVGKHLDLIKPISKGNITIYGVPYSEHSSFKELQEFVKFLKPERIIPTVNAWNASQRERMQSHFKEWLKSR